jgi:hypothetical protein
MTLPDASAEHVFIRLGLLEFVKALRNFIRKNAIAGAYSYHNKRATNKNRNEITLSAGNGGLWNRLFSSGPIAKKQTFL